MAIIPGAGGGGAATNLTYRLPVLEFVSATEIDVENNTGTSNETTILFHDNEFRSVTEDTSSTDKFRRFNITATAEFTAGTEDSGIRSGISEATNTWYSIYAVKSLIDDTKFVLAGDTTLPLQANFATLNSRYGVDSWVYLGQVRNGDNNAATGDIMDFRTSGNVIMFKEAPGSNTGLLLASASSDFVTYNLSRGTGTSDLPDVIDIAFFDGQSSAAVGDTDIHIVEAAFNVEYVSVAKDPSQVAVITAWLPVDDGISSYGSITTTRRINLRGWIDHVLGPGLNPIF